ncbi:MAG: prepilin-type N-terminal cleavage/methylation domain-containing protein [Candidatus Omnitrophica bacterium]|nr:prepilin-type N-terminal cleavage/methylation domain-containing protein [Candidatus Omnitrophota bacterium]
MKHRERTVDASFAPVEKNRVCLTGFSLVELVVVLVILSLLSFVALPRYARLKETARFALTKQTVTAIRKGIVSYPATPKALARGEGFPKSLDSAPLGEASESESFFTEVLGYDGVKAGWQKVHRRPDRYKPLLGYQEVYEYNPNDGTFVLVSKAVGGDEAPQETWSAAEASGESPKWEIYGTTQYTSWSNQYLDYVIDLLRSGNFEIAIAAKNNAAAPGQGSFQPRQGWSLSNGYTHFLVDVYVDGKKKTQVRIPASDEEYNTGTSVLSDVASGVYLIRLVWKNDSYRPFFREDANIEVRDLRLSQL